MDLYNENVGTVENKMSRDEMRNLGLSVIDLDSAMDELDKMEKEDQE